MNYNYGVRGLVTERLLTFIFVIFSFFFCHLCGNTHGTEG